ncbi:MAG: hypothetical protein WCK89_16720 [bacterium]
MKSVLQAGVCVSCGRASGRYFLTCPYCGEQVWQPRWRRAGQGVLLVLPPLLLALLAGTTRPDMGGFAQALRAVHPAPGFLFAVGIGLLCMPSSDSDVVMSSRAEGARWQVCALLGGWLMGLYAATCVVCLTYGRAAGSRAWLPACLIAACVGTAPVFFRIPWRSLVATAWLAAALAAG